MRSSEASAALYRTMQANGLVGRHRQALEDAARDLAVAVRNEAVAAERAEIERLRTALQLLADPNHHVRPIERERIARAALAPKEASDVAMD